MPIWTARWADATKQPAGRRSKGQQGMSATPRSVVLAALLCGWVHHAVADVTAIRPLTPACHQNGQDASSALWAITGTISQKDLLAVNEISARYEKTAPKFCPDPEFRLDSMGGDVEAGIGIGRVLRKMDAHAWVGAELKRNVQGKSLPDDAKCYSACVFVLIGATSRGYRDGDIGIHRPYSTVTADRNYDTVQKEQRRVAALAKAFLDEMNVSPSLFEAMSRVPPEQMRLLSVTEAEEFGIGYTDPVKQEMEDAAQARVLGITKMQYLTRKASLNWKCGALRYDSSKDYEANLATTTAHTKCEDDVLHGRR